MANCLWQMCERKITKKWVILVWNCPTENLWEGFWKHFFEFSRPSFEKRWTITKNHKRILRLRLRQGPAFDRGLLGGRRRPWGENLGGDPVNWRHPRWHVSHENLRLWRKIQKVIPDFKYTNSYAWTGNSHSIFYTCLILDQKKWCYLSFCYL